METPSPGDAASPRATLSLFCAADATQPLDVVLLSPATAAQLRVAPAGRLAIDIAGTGGDGELRLLLLAVAEAGVRPGDAVVPAWVGALAGQDAHLAAVAVKVPSEADAAVAGASAATLLAPIWTGDAEDSPPLKLEGPFMAASAAGPLASFLALARSQLRPALRRQARRAGVRLEPGAAFAIRLAGDVCAFRVVRDAGVVAADCGGVSVVQSLRRPKDADLELVRSSVTTCVTALARGPPGSGGAAKRALWEAAPRGARATSAFLWSLRAALQDGGGVPFVHLPLCQLLWELPSAPSSPRLLRQLLQGFVENLLSNAEGEVHVSGVLVLWGLDEPMPAASTRWLTAALSVLDTLPCTVIGFCTSGAGVPSSIRALFDEQRTGVPGSIQSLAQGDNASSKDEGAARRPCPDLIGREDAIAELRAGVINYFEHVNMFDSMGIGWPPRVLLHGPAGSGKTHLARWLCSQLPARVHTCWVNPGEIWSRYLGESEARLRRTFSDALAGAAGGGALLVLEGLDQLAPSSAFDAGKSDGEAGGGFRGRLVATLLTSLDGVDGGSSKGTRAGCLAILATSCIPPDKLDARVTRPGRMDRWIAVRSPTAQERLALLEHFVRTAGTRDGDTAAKCLPTCLEAASLDAGLRAKLIEASVDLQAGSLRLAAMHSWSAAQNQGRSTPNWPDVLEALGGISRSHRFGAVNGLSAAAFAHATPTFQGVTAAAADAANASLAEAAAIAVPSSDEEDGL